MAELTSPRIRVLAQALHDGPTSALDEFWRELAEGGTPLIEPAPEHPRDSLVTFVWRGSDTTENVVVIGPFGRRDPAENQLARLPGTDLWYRTYQLPKTLRATYRMAENDPLTPSAG